LQAFVNRGYFEKSAVMNVETPPTKIAFRTPKILFRTPSGPGTPFGNRCVRLTMNLFDYWTISQVLNSRI